MKITRRQLKRIILEITDDIIHDPMSSADQAKHAAAATDVKKLDEFVSMVGLSAIFKTMGIPLNSDSVSSGQPLAVRGLVKYLKQELSPFTESDLTNKEYFILANFCRECYNVLEEKMPSAGTFASPILKTKEEEKRDKLIPKGPYQSKPKSRNDMIITPPVISKQDQARKIAQNLGLYTGLKFIKPKTELDYPSIRIKGYSSYNFIGKRLGIDVGKFTNVDAIEKATGNDSKAILNGFSRFLGRFKIEKTGPRTYLIKDAYDFSDLSQQVDGRAPDLEKTQTSGVLGLFDMLMDYAKNRITMSHYNSVRRALGTNTYFKPYQIRLEIESIY